MKKKFMLNYILLIAAGVLIFSLSEYIQWYGDSYSYRFRFDTFEPIESFADIIPSQYAHYFMMNGRIWVHVLCQAFSALWGQTAFAICNAGMYIVFVLLFLRVSGRSWKSVTDLLAGILAVLFFCDTSYNANCQIGYVWSATLTLAFIILYLGPGACHGWGTRTLLFLLSLLAGNGNEAISIGTGAALIVDTFVNYKKISEKRVVMIAGFGIGGLLCCLSPGILSRASHSSADILWSSYNIAVQSRMLYVFIFTVIVLKLRHKISLKRFVSENLFFVIAMLTLLAFNFAIGIGENGRQLFGIELFSGILTLRALKGVRLPGWILGLGSAAIICIYFVKFDYLRKSNEDLGRLRMELSRSEDLKIYMDFRRYSGFVHPTELNNSVFLYYCAAYAIMDDMLDFGYAYRISRGYDGPYYKKLEIYPTALKRAIESGRKDLALKCADGNCLIVTDKNDPKTFQLERNYDIFGIRFPKYPYEIGFGDL